MNATILNEPFGKIAVLVGAVGLAVIGVNTPELLTQLHDLRRSQHEDAIVDKACEITRVTDLIRMIAQGKSDEARQVLSFQLANDIGNLRNSLADETGPIANLGRLDCSRVLRMEEMHPDYFLAADPQAREVEASIWAEVRNKTLEGSK